MPWAPIKLIPGLNADLTATDQQAGYVSTNLGRFRAGRFQKLGGWTKYYQNLVGATPRALHAYQDLEEDDRVVIGCTTALLDLTSDVLLDISPQQTVTSVAENFSTTLGDATVTVVDTEITTVTPYSAVTFLTPVAVGGLILHGTYQIATYVGATSYTIEADTVATGNVANGGAVPTFTTTSGLSTVTVGLAAHGLSVGDEIVLDISTTVGGIAISGRYTVQTVPGVDSFTITCSNSASSSAGPTSMNSGEASFRYHITLGPQAMGSTYGAGLYSAGTYGFGASLNADAGTAITATDWSFDNWGELLVACTDGGGIYWWGQNSGYLNAQLLSAAPIYNTGSFVSISQQVIISYGSTTPVGIGSYHDPLLVRWCNVGDFFTWNALATYRIPRGSECVGGTATPNRNLIWTDTDCWSADFVGIDGTTSVYGLNDIGANCGLIAKHAHAQLGGGVYWMGKANFFHLTAAGIGPMPCPVWDKVFQDLDTANAARCYAGSNTAFSEIWFFYPSASGGLGYCDKYVKVNTLTGEWDAGNLQRNCWLDQTVLNYPIAVTNTGQIYSHEYGNDADGSPLTASFETGYFYVDEGREIVFLDRIYPDFKWGEEGGSENAAIDITVKAVMFPGETPTEYGPSTVTKSDTEIAKRMRARQIALKVESDDIGSFWRLGHLRVRYSPDGRR